MALSHDNNNPLNIRDTGIPWQGATGGNGGFEVFATPEHGYRAAVKNLYTSQSKHGRDTLAKIITRWAPPEDENDTAAYIARVAADTGVDPNAVVDLKSDPALTKSLLASMTAVEGAGVGKFTDAQMESGIALANGKDPSEIDFSQQDTDHDADQYTSADDTADIVPPESRRIQQEFQNPNSLNSANWVSTVDSPTYRWTLYIVNNEVMNDPTMLHSSDSAAINSNKAKIIAMQGVTTQFTLDNFMMIAIRFKLIGIFTI